MHTEAGIPVQPEDVLSEGEYELLRRAQGGEVTCPNCTTPLAGRFYFVIVEGSQVKGVRLSCSRCGFDEY